MLKKQLLNKIGQLSASSESSSQCLASLTKWAESLPDDQPDLLPFQWPIPEGMEAVTRDGQKVIKIEFWETLHKPVLFAVSEFQEVITALPDGNIFNSDESSLDLFLRRAETSHDDKIFISIMDDFWDKSYNHSERGIGENPLPEAFQRLKTYFTTLKPVV